MTLRRLWTGVMAAVALWATIGLVVTPTAGADLSQFETTAAAEGVRIGVLAPGASLFDQLADVGIPVAQSVLTGLGVSQSFASLPYPGDIAISGPATVTALLGAPAPPPYPLYASSSHPVTPESKISQPGYELRAASSQTLSEASATAGGTTGDSGVASTNATARSRRDGDQLIGEATSVAELVNAGGVLHVGRVYARAKTTRDASGKLRRESEFHASGISIAGVAVGLSAGGLTLAGSTTPLPDNSALNQILDQAGVSVDYLKPITDPVGVVSGGLVITQKQVVNGTNVTVTYVFGRARSHASGIGSETADAALGDVLPDAGVAAEPARTQPGDAGAAPSLGAGTGGAALTTGLSPAAGAAPIASGARRSAAAGVPGPLDSRSSTYLVLLVAAAVGLGGSQLLRILGVRLRWHS